MTKQAKPTVSGTKTAKPYSSKIARFGLSKFSKAKMKRVDGWDKVEKPTQ